MVSILQERSIDVVMHFAAYITVPESMNRPGEYFTNNVSNGIQLLKAMESVRRIKVDVRDYP